MRLNPIPLLTLAVALACAAAPTSRARSGLRAGSLLAAAPPAAGEDPGREDDAARVICANERPTGTNIMRRVCRSQEQVDRDREAARALLVSPRGASRP